MAENPVEVSASLVRKLWDKHGIQKPFRFLGFCLSMIPIPGIQQAGMALDRHLSDKALRKELDDVWEAIASANERADSAEDLESSIVEVAKAVESDPNLRKRCQDLSRSLSAVDSRFILETEDSSYQELVQSVIKAGQVLISAEGNSANVIRNSEFQSPDTHLKATGGSRNYIQGSSFTDGRGSVGMQGIGAAGNVHVGPASIGYGSDSFTEMGDWVMGCDAQGNFVIGTRKPDLNAICPACGHSFDLYRSDIASKTLLACPQCGKSANIPCVL